MKNGRLVDGNDDFRDAMDQAIAFLSDQREIVIPKSIQQANLLEIRKNVGLEKKLVIVIETHLMSVLTITYKRLWIILMRTLR